MTVGTAALIVIILFFFVAIKWAFRMLIVWMIVKAAGAAAKDIKTNLLGGQKANDGNSPKV